MNIRHPKRFGDVGSPFPTESSEDGGSYYEEINDGLTVPKVALQQTSTKSESITINHRIAPDDISRRQPDLNHKVTDIQTNL